MSKFYIEENCNYTKGEGNLFLIMNDGEENIKQCLGGADKTFEGKWEVTISKEYDSETESDAELIGVVETQEEAKTLLLKNADSAHVRPPISVMRGYEIMFGVMRK